MASSIPRHPFPTGNAEGGLAVLQENAQELIDGLEAGTADLGDALGATVAVAGDATYFGRAEGHGIEMPDVIDGRGPDLTDRL